MKVTKSPKNTNDKNASDDGFQQTQTKKGKKSKQQQQQKNVQESEN